MGTRTAAPALVDFQKEIVDPAKKANAMLKNTSDRIKLGTYVLESTLSLIASKADDNHEVVVKVSHKSDLWTPRLEQAVRDRLALCQSPTMAPVRLKVVHV